MITALLFASALATAPVAPPAGDAGAMAQAVGGFYAVHQATTQDGIPDTRLRARYAPYVSPALSKLLADADDGEVYYAKQNKDSPPLVEGDLFSPNFEGISSFKVGACSVDAKRGLDFGHCNVTSHYAAAHPRPQDKAVDWTDTVFLVRTPGGWKIDDIGYGGNWDFGNHGKLSDVLKAAIDDAHGAP
ncbi:MAG TPA: hypothetical protein VGG48_13000 [Rhizomicrobium sp.]|jgi:hypothetical protein